MAKQTTSKEPVRSIITNYNKNKIIDKASLLLRSKRPYNMEWMNIMQRGLQ